MKFEEYFPQIEAFQDDLDIATEAIKRSARIFVVGNGGSETIASHFVVDLNICKKECHSLSTPAVLTAMSNDFGYEQVYAKQLETFVSFAHGNGLLIAISSSGNSANIINAVETFRNFGGEVVVTLSGFDADNKLNGIGNINIHIPERDYGIVEVAHMMLLHYIINKLRWGDRS